MEVNILGTSYKIYYQTDEENQQLKECDGYCDWTTKTIVVRKEVEGTLGDMNCYIKKVLRHEITHAFLIESGLHECSEYSPAWSMNETMVDWIARQGVKIYQAWEKAGAI